MAGRGAGEAPRPACGRAGSESRIGGSGLAGERRDWRGDARVGPLLLSGLSVVKRPQPARHVTDIQDIALACVPGTDTE